MFNNNFVMLRLMGAPPFQSMANGGGKGGSSKAPEPDPRIGAATEAQVALNKEIWQEQQRQTQELQPYVRNLYGLAGQTMQQQMDISNELLGFARQQQGAYQTMYAPMEQQAWLDAIGAGYLPQEDVNALQDMIANAQNQRATSLHEYQTKDYGAELPALKTREQYRAEMSPNYTSTVAAPARSAYIYTPGQGQNLGYEGLIGGGNNLQVSTMVPPEELTAFNEYMQGRGQRPWSADEYAQFMGDPTVQQKIRDGSMQAPWLAQTGGQTKVDEAALNRAIDERMAADLAARNTQTAEARARGLSDYQYQQSLTDVEFNKKLSEAVNKATQEAMTREGTRAATTAAADVNSAYNVAQETRNRQLAAAGINPASGAWQQAGLDIARANALAAGQTLMRNAAEENVRQQGIALRQGIVNLGRGIAGTSGQAYGQTVGAGQAAQQTAQAPLGASATLWSANRSAAGGLSNAYGSQASVLGNLYNSQLNAWSQQQQANAQNAAGLWGGIGRILGGVAGFAIGGPVGGAIGSGIGGISGGSFF